MPTKAGVCLLLLTATLSFAVTASEGTMSDGGGRRARMRNLLQLDATNIDRYSYVCTHAHV